MSKKFIEKLTDAAIAVDKDGVAHLVLVVTDLTHKLIVTADFTNVDFVSGWEQKYDPYNSGETDAAHKYYVKRNFSLPLSNVRVRTEKLPLPELTQAQVEELLGFKVKLISEEKEENK